MSEDPTKSQTTIAENKTSEEVSPNSNDLSDAKDEEQHASRSAPKNGPPNGGVRAWLQVVASFFLFFNTWGLINAFGVFQTYYDMTLPRSPSDISWIGTFQAFELLCIGAVTGPLYDKGYMRHLLVVGTLFFVFGLMMTSLSSEYYQIFLAQSVAVGIGSGCLQVPSLAVPAQYFTTKRATAIGIGAAGGSVGAVIYPVVFRKLQLEVSFGWATRALGFIALATLIVVNIIMRPLFPPSGTSRALIDLSALRNPSFVVLTLAIFFYLMGIYMPFFYMTTWAQTNLGTSPDLSFYMFLILNAGSSFGRILPGILADKFGSLNLLIVGTTISGIMILAWISVTKVSELVVFCIFYGFFSGAGVSLPGSVMSNIIPDLSKVGTWLGMCFSLAALGLLIGIPVAGAILDASPDKSFIGAQCFSGCAVIIGAALLCLLRYMRYKSGATWRVLV